jgi:hypothetical protein
MPEETVKGEIKMSKVRAGFDSNSSSSSFLIYGTHIERGEVQELFEKLFPEEKIDDDEDEDDVYEMIEKISEKVGIDYTSGYEDYYLGESWDSIGDDETGKQFKERIEKKIKEIIPDATVTTHEEAWYD